MSGVTLIVWWKWRCRLVKNSMNIRSITTLEKIKNVRVLVRLDLNVPIKKNKVVDNARLKAALPTLQLLRKKGAKIVVLTHLGRPEGKTMAELKVDPIAKELGRLLKIKISKLDTKNWALKSTEWGAIKNSVAALKPGGIIMADNVRFAPGEEGNDPAFAQKMAELGDLFVFDGFAVAHRPAASVVGLAKCLPAYGGLLMTKEIAALDAVVRAPKHPLVAIIGGAKMETRLPVMKELGKKADAVIVGGGIVNTMLLALGYGVGDSLVDKEFTREAKKLAVQSNVLLPIDVVVGTRDGQNWRVVEVGPQPHQICAPGEAIFDLGPNTIGWFSEILQKPATIVWSGAVGLFEQRPYNEGTFTLAKVLAAATKQGTFTVAGGGETLLALDALSLTSKLSFVSTAGGAMLEYLAGRNLPGVKILQSR